MNKMFLPGLGWLELASLVQLPPRFIRHTEANDLVSCVRSKTVRLQEPHANDGARLLLQLAGDLSSTQMVNRKKTYVPFFTYAPTGDPYVPTKRHAHSISPGSLSSDFERI